MATPMEADDDEIEIQSTTEAPIEDMQLEEPIPLPLPVTASGKSRFEIRNWDAVALWAWDIEMSNCGICRNHIMDLCIECQANRDSVDVDECPIAWGMCNHAYHFHCISRFLKTHHVCPLDNKEWKFKKYGR